MGVELPLRVVVTILECCVTFSGVKLSIRSFVLSHPRSTVVLLDTGTPGTSREIYSEDADGETRTRNPWITNPVL